MRNLLRKPLPWMIMAECAVVAALVVVAWHMVASTPVQVVPILPASPPAADSGGAADQVPASLSAQPTSRAKAPAPGLNVDVNFWRLRLAELNHGQESFEALEWRIVHSAMDAAHRYVESVVIPSIARAERRN
jgi:hypothetical protein